MTAAEALTAAGRDAGSAFFRALAAADRVIDHQRTVLINHHAITEVLELADVVVACNCESTAVTDGITWAAHVQELLNTTVPASHPTT